MIMKHKIVMDLDRAEEKSIDVMQDDKNSRALEMHLKANGMPWCMPEGCAVLVRYKKPDGSSGAYDSLPDGTRAWSIRENVMTVVLAPQVCTVPGDVMLTVTFFRGDAQLNCFQVCVKIHKGFGSALKSENYVHVRGFIPQPENVAPGDYLKVVAADERGNIVTVAGDVPEIPDRVSQLENDAGYLTEHQDISHLLPRRELEETLSQMDLGAKAFYVTVNDNGDMTGTTDKSYEEIMAAYEAGSPVIVLLQRYTDEPEVLGVAVCSHTMTAFVAQVYDAYGQMWGVSIHSEGCDCVSMPIAADNSGLVLNVLICEDCNGVVNKTAAEVIEALDAGRNIVCDAEFPDEPGVSYRLQLYSVTEEGQMLQLMYLASFASIFRMVQIMVNRYNNNIVAVGTNMQSDIIIDNTTWIGAEPVDFTDTINNMITAKLPTELKNPEALTINGISYDGSQAVSVNIEGGSGGSVPGYVRNEAERLAAVVQSRQNENTISAILSSDYHLPNSSHAYYGQILESITHAGQAMKLLRNQLSLEFEAKLGDLIWDSGENQAEALANFRLVHALVSEGDVPDRFEGNGNHDHLQSNSMPLTDSQVYANIGIYNKRCVRDPENRSGGYCFKDYEEFKLRVVLLNTSETDDGSFAVSSAQLTWLDNAFSVPADEGWGILILSHHPLDWGGSTTAVMNKVKSANGIIANLHGHVHTFTQDKLTGTEIPRLAIPNVCFYRNNEYGENGKAENSEGIEFGTTTTYKKTANSANDTSFCVLTIDRDAGKLYLDRYGSGIDRVEDVPTWDKKGYTNLVPTSQAADSTEPYNGTGYKNGVYLSSEGGDGTDSACVATGYIPYTWNKSDAIYVKGAQITEDSHVRIYGYGAKGGAPSNSAMCSGTNKATYFAIDELESGNYYKLTSLREANNVAFLRLSLIGTGENLIVTVNAPIAT